MYTLHYFPDNASLAPHMLLEEIGTPYSLALVDRANQAQKSQRYLALNPYGRIPTLEHDEGVVFEAAAIMLYLVDQHPDAGFAPPTGTAARGHFYQWLAFLTNSYQEQLMLIYYVSRVAGEEPSVQELVKRKAGQRIGEFLTVMESHLARNGPYFLGARPSAVDFYFTMLAGWSRQIEAPPQSRPAMSKLLELIHARPAVRRVLAAEEISTPA